MVYFTISIGGTVMGDVTFRLYDEIAPKTCKNFRSLCTGEMGLGKTTGKPLTYEKSIFHRIIPDFMIQGGDFSARNGTGGESIYGGKFNDEPFTAKHTKPGLLSMANAGPNTNGSQFFITLASTPHLNGKHVVFGEVVDGMQIIRMAEKVDTSNDRPVSTQQVVIEECGVVKPKPAQETSTYADATDDRGAKRSKEDKKASKKAAKAERKAEKKAAKKAAKAERKAMKKSKKSSKKKRKKAKYSSDSGSDSDSDSDSGHDSDNSDNRSSRKTKKKKSYVDDDSLHERPDGGTPSSPRDMSEKEPKGDGERGKEKAKDPGYVGKDGVLYKGRGNMRYRGGRNDAGGNRGYRNGGRDRYDRDRDDHGWRRDGRGRDRDVDSRERGRDRGARFDSRERSRSRDRDRDRDRRDRSRSRSRDRSYRRDPSTSPSPSRRATRRSRSDSRDRDDGNDNGNGNGNGARDGSSRGNILDRLGGGDRRAEFGRSSITDRVGGRAIVAGREPSNREQRHLEDSPKRERSPKRDRDGDKEGKKRVDEGSDDEFARYQREAKAKKAKLLEERRAAEIDVDAEEEEEEDEEVQRKDDHDDDGSRGESRRHQRSNSVSSCSESSSSGSSKSSAAS
jgi:cyclophilin family peptidyl-prolyl cis-trans isomerase